MHRPRVGASWRASTGADRLVRSIADANLHTLFIRVGEWCDAREAPKVGIVLGEGLLPMPVGSRIRPRTDGKRGGKRVEARFYETRHALTSRLSDAFHDQAADLYDASADMLGMTRHSLDAGQEQPMTALLLRLMREGEGDP